MAKISKKPTPDGLDIVVRTLFRTGESLAVTLPVAWVRHCRLGKGDKVEIVINDGLVIRPKKESIDLTE
jgi:antitoxin component of MazEF toxin-antitoxin module